MHRRLITKRFPGGATVRRVSADVCDACGERVFDSAAMAQMAHVFSELKRRRHRSNGAK
ncbi:MAG: YgiT-type zinc finger protein [Planctomycetes bacterium]|nr:YgiT-type zinc finger protein [Planctomycetota bacterium]